MFATTSVDEVMDGLDVLVADAYRRGDRSGLFAALYRRTTSAIVDAVHAGRFDDPERMQRVAVAFARRYFDACQAHRSGGDPTGPWRYAFARAREIDHPLIVHVLLGIHAHTEFDLALATASSQPPPQLQRFEQDYLSVDTVLHDVIGSIRTDLLQVSPRIAAVDRRGLTPSDRWIGRRIARTRRTAWRRARTISRAPDHARPNLLARLERQVTAAAQCAFPPARQAPGPRRALLRWIRDAESDDVRDALDVLHSPDRR